MGFLLIRLVLVARLIQAAALLFAGLAFSNGVNPGLRLGLVLFCLFRAVQAVLEHFLALSSRDRINSLHRLVRERL